MASTEAVIDEVKGASPYLTLGDLLSPRVTCLMIREQTHSGSLMEVPEITTVINFRP